jgi:hypothetical protein
LWRKQKLDLREQIQFRAKIPEAAWVGFGARSPLSLAWFVAVLLKARVTSVGEIKEMIANCELFGFGALVLVGQGP